MMKWIKGLVIGILVVLLLGLVKYFFLDGIIEFFTTYPMLLGVLFLPVVLLLLGVLHWTGLLDMEQNYETPTQPGWEDFTP